MICHKMSSSMCTSHPIPSVMDKNGVKCRVQYLQLSARMCLVIYNFLWHAVFFTGPSICPAIIGPSNTAALAVETEKSHRLAVSANIPMLRASPPQKQWEMFRTTAGFFDRLDRCQGSPLLLLHRRPSYINLREREGGRHLLAALEDTKRCIALR